jgi:hypothetical protein
MGDLRTLAEKFVRLSKEVEETRSAMLACLTNGADPRPFSPAVRPRLGGRQKANVIAAREAEAQVIDRLRETADGNCGTRESNGCPSGHSTGPVEAAPLTPTPVVRAPWVRSISSYGVRTVLGLPRFG